MKAYAKLNLCLDVFGRRQDGFHEINSIMQQIDLADELTFNDSDEVIVDSPFTDDIMLKAARLVKERFKIRDGVKIMVEKKIPHQAGLGGGSSDCAVALAVLNKKWELGLSLEQLALLGAELGADVPFFLYGGASFAAGKGERVVPLKMPKLNFLIVKPDYSISTKWAYDELDKVKYNAKHTSARVRDGGSVIENMHNDFIHIQQEEVKEIITQMKDNGALCASITGKGPTVFGIFDSRADAISASKDFSEHPFVYAGRSI
ncbi:MAG TPA: 4-(cytidine 5'-diphospho)-2-C-methyl-D-erythritol kinase [Candidatus Nanoarchaeia archaeon]|nr:4-(cytidine 5'-diphospho)-2-C-methyl-D-erythritol kinase [Candidatus Nanoarchaeia archaeon]